MWQRKITQNLRSYLSVALIVYIFRVPTLPCTSKASPYLTQRPRCLARSTFALSGGRWGCLGTTACSCQEWTPSAVSVLCVGCRWGTPLSSHHVDTDSVTSASKNTSGKLESEPILSTIVCQGVFFSLVFYLKIFILRIECDAMLNKSGLFWWDDMVPNDKYI